MVNASERARTDDEYGMAAVSIEQCRRRFPRQAYANSPCWHSGYTLCQIIV